MKIKEMKFLKFLATAVFFGALAFSVKVSLDDSLLSTSDVAVAQHGTGYNKSDSMAYCSGCGGRLCLACTTKYSHGCSVTENCTVRY
ncbi:MAG: hypothetical protein ACEPOZ_20725 [Marinifilaceae bacterium]